MRVRHLQSHLADQELVYSGKLEKLRQCRVGVDAVFWLRSIQALKDPFADALGGIPPGIFGFVDKELELFRRTQIQPLFVFQGIAPGPQHSMFVSRMDQQMEMAWTYLAKGQKSEAQKCFAVSTSRINGDFVYFIFNHLKHRGYECIQAPYFAGAQLAHFAEKGAVHTVFGPPGLLLYGVQCVVIHIDFHKLSYDWVDLSAVLTKWQLSKDQFVDACMLAGTEYCLTYPYLNLGHIQQAPPGRFNFDAAIFIIKQAPLINWMQTFPTEDMKNDHVEGYCTCKVLVQNSPVLQLDDYGVRPFGTDKPVPSDFSKIMGDKLPNALYYLMLNGVVSHKLPQALAKGEWTDKSQPLVDTREFREMLIELGAYRTKALGLIAQHLNPSFQNKAVLCKAFWDSAQVRAALPGTPAHENARIIRPNIEDGGHIHLRWRITADALKTEMARQKTSVVDFKFCLNWHKEEVDNVESTFTPTPGRDPVYCDRDRNCLAALVHLMVLEQLEFIDEEGAATILGVAVAKTSSRYLEPTFVAVQLLMLGCLSGQPFDPASQDRPFPDQVSYPKLAEIQPGDKITGTLLLCRIMSLVPMKLKNDMWNADVDFDLAAFHSVVRILKRTLRQVVEASLASVLLQDLSKVQLLPPGFMSASPKSYDPSQTPALLPTFMLPRACMGIVVRHFLDFTGDAQAFQKDMTTRFPCCINAIEDLKNAFAFWNEFTRCVNEFSQQIEIDEFAQEMNRATEVILKPQQQRLGIFPLKE